MKHTKLFTLTLLLAIFSSEATRTSIGNRFELPPGWTFARDPPNNEPVKFTVLLKQKNLDVLDRKFTEVSDPSHPSYGKFLTREEVNQLTSPPKEAFQSVTKWLSSYPNARLSYGPDYVSVQTVTKTASKMLGTTFKTHRHSQTGEVLVRAHGRISVPTELRQYVDFVAGASELFTGTSQAVFPFPPGGIQSKNFTTHKFQTNNDILITPEVLREYYNVPKDLVATNPNNLQGIAAFDDFFSAGAFEKFREKYQVPKVNITVFGDSCLPDCDEGESDLDMQYITAMGRGVDTYFVKKDASYWVLEFVTEAMNMKRIPYVFSISYGWAELGQCNVAERTCAKLGYSAQQYVDRTNVGFQKLAAMGISVLVADGDDGAASLGGATGNCPIDSKTYCMNGGCEHSSSKCAAISVQLNDNSEECHVPMGLGSEACRATLADNKKFNAALSNFFRTNRECSASLDQDSRMQYHIFSNCPCEQLRSTTLEGYKISPYSFDSAKGEVFVADYPASSPYVTSVGATQFLSKDGKKVDKEVVASIQTGAIITTGGGFSKFQKSPNYQKKAVDAWSQQDSSVLAASPSFSYNTSFRGYPDISFNGHRYSVFISSTQSMSCPCREILVDGTSASAPALAGLISLINDALLNAGKPQLGFLNPLLYKMADESPETFNDITEGDTKCSRAYCCEYGYSATKGWDPATGLGTPDFSKVLKYVKKIKGF